MVYHFVLSSKDPHAPTFRLFEIKKKLRPPIPP